jgi:hypothetical protein
MAYTGNHPIGTATVNKLSIVSDAWSRKRLAWFCARLMLGIVVIWVPNTQAASLPESTNRLMFARELNRTYIDPLLLPGKPASYAVEVMLGEGFRCSLDLVSEIGLDEPPLTRCFKSSTRFAPKCPDLYVTVRFERQPQIRSREELLKQLDTVRVRNAMAFCPYPNEVSSEFVTAHDAAEAALARQVKEMGLHDSALAAYQKLILQGYYCGFEVKAVEEGDRPAAQLICSRWRTRIRFCHEARLAIDIDWPAGVSSAKQFYGALGKARVKSVRTSCELPIVVTSGIFI